MWRPSSRSSRDRETVLYLGSITSRTPSRAVRTAVVRRGAVRRREDLEPAGHSGDGNLLTQMFSSSSTARNASKTDLVHPRICRRVSSLGANLARGLPSGVIACIQEVHSVDVRQIPLILRVCCRCAALLTTSTVSHDGRVEIARSAVTVAAPARPRPHPGGGRGTAIQQIGRSWRPC